MSDSKESVSDSDSEVADEDVLKTNEAKRQRLNEKEKSVSRKQKFSQKWLENPEFSGWLVENEIGKAKCKCCNVLLSTKKSDLLKHSRTTKHTSNARKISNSKTITSLFEEQNASKEVILANLKYSLLVVAHNFSFNSVQHIVSMSKTIFKDSVLSRKIKLSRTKCSLIVRNVISPVICDDLKRILREKHFSVLVDESSDVSNNRVLCILVRFINNNNNLSTQLLDCLRIGADDGTAKGLFRLFENCLKSFNLKFENIVGYCSDNANVMMGAKESFKTYLFNRNEQIIASSCICHSGICSI